MIFKFLIKINQPIKNHILEMVRDFPDNVNRGLNRANQMIQNARDIIRSVLIVQSWLDFYYVILLKPKRHEQGIQLDIIFGVQAEDDNIDEALGDELEDHEIDDEEELDEEEHEEVQMMD